MLFCASTIHSFLWLSSFPSANVPQFVQSLTDGHPCCFQHGVISSKVDVSIHEQVLLGICVSISLL